MYNAYWENRSSGLRGIAPPSGSTLRRTMNVNHSSNFRFFDPQLSAHLDELHDRCDTACFATTDLGMTLPTDMDGGLDLWRWRRLLLQIPDFGYDLRGSWFSRRENEVPVIRAIRSGRPAVMGSGDEAHYGLATAYFASETYFPENSVINWGPQNGKRFTGINCYILNAGWGSAEDSGGALPREIAIMPGDCILGALVVAE